MFKARRRNLKNLTISNPVLHETSSPVTPVSEPVGVVLVSRFNFTAETDEELSVIPGEYLRLVDRPGDGWLKVQRLSSGDVGLIPASYVRISVNDLLRPITLQWLNETEDDVFDFEKPTPKQISCLQVLQDNERFWYRIDVRMSNGDEVYMLKSYQDFYSLHYKLTVLNVDNLPALPQPLKSCNTKDKRYLENLLIRCNDLNVYLNKLVKFNFFQYDEFRGFLSKGVTNPARKSTVNNILLPGGVNVMDLVSGCASMAESTSTNSFGSLIDTYERRDSVFSKNGPVTPSAQTDGFNDDVLTPITPVTPTTPNFDKFVNTYTKVKVILNNQESDIILLKVKNADIDSLTDLKKLISHKIYKDLGLVNHYKLATPGATLNDFELVQYVKSAPKVTLNLVRCRGSV